MYRIIFVLALAVLSSAQDAAVDAAVEAEANEAIAIPNPGLPKEIFSEPAISTGKGVIVEAPLPVEVAQAGPVAVAAEIPAEIVEYTAPAVSLSTPIVNLPKGAQEIVDVPHASIALTANSVQNKDIILNLPSPSLEGPQPIIRNKNVLFRLPQPIFYIPSPIVQHKPIVYRIGHSLRTITPSVAVKPYFFKVPQVQITGKSAYTQPIPAVFGGKSFV